MYRLSEAVFIAWGGNRDLAQAVSAELKKHGIESIVGGEPDRRAEDFIGKRVIDQMGKCSRAIILAKAYDQKGFRPNLMFEWGYLLARLRSGSILVVIIDSPRENIASDLQGFFAESLPDTIRGKAARARWIANTFIGTRQPDPFEPFDTLVNWSRTKIFIENQIKGYAAPTPERLSKCLVTGLLSATYCHEIEEMEQHIKHVGALTSNVSSPYFLLASLIVDYTKTGKMSSGKGGSNTRQKKLTEYRRLQVQLGPCVTCDDIYVKAIAFNYRGKCHEKLARLSSGVELKKELYSEAVNDFLEAEESFGKLDLDENSRVMWLCYVHRNLARTYESLRQIEPATKFAISALNFRHQLYAYLDNSPRANAMTKAPQTPSIISPSSIMRVFRETLTCPPSARSRASSAILKRPVHGGTR